jgi:transcriptional regulator with XRE-family HTH domain
MIRKCFTYWKIDATILTDSNLEASMDIADEKRIKLFQKNLGTIRKVAGWTAERFGEEIGVTRQTISNLEKGRTPMTKTQYLACRAVLTYEIAESENQGLAQVIRTLVDEPAESTTADVPNAQPFSETGEQEIAAVTTGTIAGLSALTAALAVGVSPFAAVVGTAAVRTVAKVASSQMSTKKGE